MTLTGGSCVQVRATTFCDMMLLTEAAFAEVSRQFPQLAELVEPGRKRRAELIKKRTCSLGNSAKNLCSAIAAAQGRKGMLGVVNVRQSGGGANGERGSPRLSRRLNGSIDRLSGSGDSPPPNGERRSSPGRARRRVTS